MEAIRGKKMIVVITLAMVLLLAFSIITCNRPAYKTPKVKISSLLSACISLAESGGKQVVNVRRSELETRIKGQTKEGANEYVTQGDQKSHNLITSGFKSLWPTLHLRSEEKGSSTETPSVINLSFPEISKVKGRDEEVNINDVTIWIDPLDATQEYTEGGDHPELLEYVMVMICIVVDSYPIAGVLHQPFVKDGVTYWGWVDHGISDNLKTTSQRQPKPAEFIRVVSSRSHSGTVKDLVDKMYTDHKVEQLIAAGAGYKTVEVVNDKADLYVHSTKIKKWDTCAGNALINSLGGFMTTFDGREVDYGYKADPVILDGLIAAVEQSKHTKFLSRYHNMKKNEQQ